MSQGDISGARIELPTQKSSLAINPYRRSIFFFSFFFSWNTMCVSKFSRNHFCIYLYIAFRRLLGSRTNGLLSFFFFFWRYLHRMIHLTFRSRIFCFLSTNSLSSLRRKYPWEGYNCTIPSFFRLELLLVYSEVPQWFWILLH